MTNKLERLNNKLNELCKENHLEFLGRDPNNDRRVQIKCKNNNITTKRIEKFKKRPTCTCEECTGRKNWDTESIKKLVEDMGYKYISYEIKERYEKHVTFICNNNTNNTMLIHNLIRYGECSCEKCTGVISWNKENISMELERHNYTYVSHYIDDASGLRVKSICPKGNEYDCKFSHFLDGARCDCCKAKSKAENYIMKEYDKYDIPYLHEYTFDDCKHQNKLKFDIVVFSDIYKTKILYICELDGIQHTQPSKFSNSVTDEEAIQAFELTKIKDNIKTEYCKNNNIPLVRVPHTVKIKDIYNYIENKLLSDHDIILRDFLLPKIKSA